MLGIARHSHKMTDKMLYFCNGAETGLIEYEQQQAPSAIKRPLKQAVTPNEACIYTAECKFL